MDGRIVRCGIIRPSSCQSAATFEIIKASGHESVSCKKRYSKYWTLSTGLFWQPACNMYHGV